MTNSYVVTTYDQLNTGERVESVESFPKCREGLISALEYTRSHYLWIIWFNDEIVEQSE
jgi:hypothetical protein